MQRYINLFYKKCSLSLLFLFLANLFSLYGAGVGPKESKEFEESTTSANPKQPLELQLEHLQGQLVSLRESVEGLQNKLQLGASALILLQEPLIDLKDILVFGKKTTSKKKAEEKKEEKDYLSILLEDMKKYKTTNSGFHAGHLYAHSVWVEQTICDWCYSSQVHGWCKYVAEEDKRIVALAGLLHDVGKAGDGDYSYFDKSTHPEVGFQYLMNKKTYFLASGENFDFDKLFSSLKVSPEDRKLIAVLVGIHWDFGRPIEETAKEQVNGAGGSVIMFDKKTENVSLSNKCKWYLDKLKGFVKKADYNGGKIDERLLRMAILIGASDVKGSQKADNVTKSLFCLNVDIARDHPGASYMYEIFQFHIPAIMETARDYLVDYFKNVWEPKYAD